MSTPLRDLFQRCRPPIHRAWTACRQGSRRIAAVVATAIGIDEVLLVLALLLIAAGLWPVWQPGAYLVPGIVLLWIVLPQRASWIARPPAAPSEKTARRTS